MLNYREQQVANHLKEYRPKEYQELVKAGKLEATVRQMWEDYTDQLHNLTVIQGLPYNQATEKLRELIYPQSEKEQPHLGEDQSAKDPTSIKITS